MLNFGKINNGFLNILTNVVMKDDKAKRLLKKYKDTIKESEILKTQYLLYKNIEQKTESDALMANLYVSEAIKLLEKYSKSDIEKENKKLVKLLKENNGNIEDSYELSDLHESITNLIFTKRNPKNVDKIITETKKVADFILNNKIVDTTTSLGLPNSVAGKLLINKYNEKYKDLSEDEKNVLKVLIEPKFEVKKSFYLRNIGECVQIIDTLLKESDEESKEKLLKVKEKLGKEFDGLNENNVITKIIKLVGLKDNLKNS